MGIGRPSLPTRQLRREMFTGFVIGAKNEYSVLVGERKGNIPKAYSDPQCATKRAGCIVRGSSVVVYKHTLVAAVAKQGPAELPDGRRSLQPARCFQVEVPELLQVPVFFFCQQLNAHAGSQLHSIPFRLVFFPGVQGFPIVTEAPAVFWTFRGTIVKKVFTRLFVLPHYVGF